MRWYINDLSLQGQFAERPAFEAVLRALISARSRIGTLRTGLRTSRSLAIRPVSPSMSVREAIQRSADVDLRRMVLNWFDRTGPFVEDDRVVEQDDYFEYSNMDITDTGLGEAARRLKHGDSASTFSFRGGAISFEVSPLAVLHGIPEERLGAYEVPNMWHVDALADSAIAAGPLIGTWQALVESARARYPRLIIGDDVYTNPKLAREPFDAVIRDRAFELMKYLDRYMQGLDDNGKEGAQSQDVIASFFRGDRALFSGESVTNQRDFTSDLTFRDPVNRENTIFAHWHGKISHRHFRMHFEWPVPVGSRQLKVVYLGPKLTKS